jgi:hypothetical protein
MADFQAYIASRVFFGILVDDHIVGFVMKTASFSGGAVGTIFVTCFPEVVLYAGRGTVSLGGNRMN